VAFFRFSRDKRGYEHFYLMEPAPRGTGRPRVLYWFRTPPNVKVGRGPFEPEIRRSLEAQNPEVVFDWKAIVQAPIPPVDAERWRERRRAERAMREAADAGDLEATTPPEASAAPEAEPVEPDVSSNQPATGAADEAASPASRRRRRRRRDRRKSQIQQETQGSEPVELQETGDSKNGQIAQTENSGPTIPDE
jgi:hypothetical protein